MSSTGTSAPSTANADGTDLNRRIEDLNTVESNLAEILRLSQSCLSELSKEKQISKNKMEDAGNQFKRSLSSVTEILCNQLAYLSNVCVGSAHQGSTFASQQNISLAESTEFALHSELAKLEEKHHLQEKTPRFGGPMNLNQ